MSAKPFRLEPIFHQKIWGVTNLEPWFRPSEKKIGEVWFSMPGPLPVLVKFIFAAERLSLQVHPNDEYALAREGRPGKTEMFYVLRAEPGAKLAAGFLEPVTKERARQAALSGEIEHLVRWFPVSAGQVYLIPSGVVHALGAGIAACEIEQNSTVTYRLYDYGRPRELHLAQALDVAELGPYSGPTVREGNLLAACQYFVAERMEVTEARYQPDAARFHLLVVLEGSGRIGSERFLPGEIWYVPPGAEPFPLAADTRALLLKTYVPG